MPLLNGSKLGEKRGGRKKGTPNKITADVKASLLSVYAEIGGDEQFAKWAKKNQTTFYKLWIRLLPPDLPLPPMLLLLAALPVEVAAAFREFLAEFLHPPGTPLSGGRLSGADGANGTTARLNTTSPPHLLCDRDPLATAAGPLLYLCRPAGVRQCRSCSVTRAWRR